MSEADHSAARANPERATNEEIKNRLNALSSRLDAYADQLFEEREQRQAVENELAELREEHVALQDELDELRQRTDLLKLVNDSDTADAKQRSVALIQHMRRAARSREEIDEKPRIAIDRDRAEEILHYPDVDRTTIYTDLDRAERLVGDKDIMHYTEGELVLNLEAGDPADHVDDVHRTYRGE